MAWKECLQYIAILISQSKDPVRLVIEQGTSVYHDFIYDVFRETFNMLNMGSYDHYAIPKYLPKVEMGIADKRSTGVQIVDFLIWAKNRTHFSKPDKTWESRLVFTSKSATGPFLDQMHQGTIVFKCGVRQNNLHVYPQAALPLPDFQGAQQAIDLFANVINEVLIFLFEDSDPKMSHISHNFSTLVGLLRKNRKTIGFSEIKAIAFCYLWIFDMKPLYRHLQQTDAVQFQKFILTKRLVALVLRTELVDGAIFRQKIMEEFADLTTNPAIKIPKSM